jgi:CheY-like chemotaxis protein
MNVSFSAGSADAAPHKRVLIIEDNVDGATSLSIVLEWFGYEVRVAFTGPEGLAAAREWLPDIVLCDIGLPGLDGYGVARALRRERNTAAIRLIALTAYGSDEDRRRAIEAGFDQHFTKPVDLDVLQAELARSSSRDTPQTNGLVGAS